MSEFNREDYVIYIADDSETVRKMVGYVLNKVGYKVEFFEDGELLYRNLSELPDTRYPSVVILDVNMPNMNGFEACYQIKLNLPKMKAPIVFFTSSAESEQSAMEVGADEFIVKPFEPGKLIERIDHWVGKNTNWSVEDKAGVAGDKPLVMFADDSGHFRKMVSLILQSSGFQVEAYQDGLELLLNLKDKEPSVIVLDLEMPRLNGIDTCERLRHEFADIKCPVLFFTSQTSQDTVREVRRVGGNDFVNKSLPPETLSERVLHWVEKFKNT